VTEGVDPRDTEAEEVVGAEAAEAAQPTTAPAADGSSDALEQELQEEQEAVAHQAPHAVQGEGVHPDTALAAERLLDLQRLQAEYVNYKRRVDRDRAMVQERAVQDVLETLLPVLDDIHAAREHGDLQTGPFAAIADKFEQTLTKFGLTRFGDVGEPFDPMQHEALMHTQAELPEGADTTTVVTVLQPGYRAGDQVIRPARVAVADPQ
jgi:molecular chaperone GrpE